MCPTHQLDPHSPRDPQNLSFQNKLPPEAKEHEGRWRHCWTCWPLLFVTCVNSQEDSAASSGAAPDYEH